MSGRSDGVFEGTFKKTTGAFMFMAEDGFANVSLAWDYTKCPPERIYQLLSANMRSFPERQCRKPLRQYEDSFTLGLPELISWEPNSIFTIGMTKANRFPLAGQIRMQTPNIFKGRPFYLEPSLSEVQLDDAFGWGKL